jgi:hypothetical protein
MYAALVLVTPDWVFLVYNIARRSHPTNLSSWEATVMAISSESFIYRYASFSVVFLILLLLKLRVISTTQVQLPWNIKLHLRRLGARAFCHTLATMATSLWGSQSSDGSANSQGLMILLINVFLHLFLVYNTWDRTLLAWFCPQWLEAPLAKLDVVPNSQADEGGDMDGDVLTDADEQRVVQQAAECAATQTPHTPDAFSTAMREREPSFVMAYKLMAPR